MHFKWYVICINWLCSSYLGNIVSTTGLHSMKKEAQLRRTLSVFCVALLFGIFLFTSPAYSDLMAGSLSIEIHEDFYGNFLEYGFVVHGISGTEFDSYLLIDPEGNTVIDYSTAEVWGDDQSFNMFQGGYQQVDTGYYTLQGYSNDQLIESYVIPYDVQAVDIPSATPIITYPVQDSSLSDSTVTIAWEAIQLPEGYFVGPYSVGVFGDNGTVLDQWVEADGPLQAVFTLLPGSYTSILQGAAHQEDGNYNQQLFRWVEFDVESAAAPVPEPATVILMGIGLIGLAGASRKKFLKK